MISDRGAVSSSQPTNAWRQRRKLGADGPEVTGICVGTSPLGSMPNLYGYPVDDARASATLQAVLSGPFNFLDTSNGYGEGRAEARIGDAIRTLGRLPANFVIATKADADPSTGDFSGARARRSLEESLSRLGLDRLDLFYLHDPEFHGGFPAAMAKGGSVEMMVALMGEGLVSQIGIAAGPISMLMDFVGTGLFSVVLSHNRFTLLDQSAIPLITESNRRGMAFVNGAPYGGGMLVKGPDLQPKYCYAPAPEKTLRAARAMQRACDAYGVPLAAAALQFSLRDPRVTSTVVGMSTPARIEETTRLADHPIPSGLWEELDALAPYPGDWLK